VYGTDVPFRAVRVRLPMKREMKMNHRGSVSPPCPALVACAVEFVDVVVADNSARPINVAINVAEPHARVRAKHRARCERARCDGTFARARVAVDDGRRRARRETSVDRLGGRGRGIHPSVRSFVTVGHFDGSRTVKPLRWTVDKSHREDVDGARRRTERVIERWIDVIVLRVTPGNSIPPPEVD
jgi:hypothetical protein